MTNTSLLFIHLIGFYDRNTKTMPLYGVFKDTKQFNGARSSNNVAYKTLSEKSDLTRPFFKSREKTCRK